MKWTLIVGFPLRKMGKSKIKKSVTFCIKFRSGQGKISEVLISWGS